MQERAVITRRGPAEAFHLEAAARFERLAGEFLFEVVGLDGPFFRKAVKREVLEPHFFGRQKATEYTCLSSSRGPSFHRRTATAIQKFSFARKVSRSALNAFGFS